MYLFKACVNVIMTMSLSYENREYYIVHRIKHNYVLAEFILNRYMYKKNWSR